MSIFNKENGTIPLRCTPFHKTKKFLDMSKIKENNPVLQRSGEKISFVLIINALNFIAITPMNTILATNRKSIN